MNAGVFGRSEVKGGLRMGGAVNCFDIEGLKTDRSGGRGKDCCLKGLLCLAAKGFAPNKGVAVCEPVVVGRCDVFLLLLLLLLLLLILRCQGLRPRTLRIKAIVLVFKVHGTFNTAFAHVERIGRLVR